MEIDWRLIFFIVLLVHGMGHLLGVVSISGLIKLPGFTNESWLLSGKLGLDKPIIQALAVIWLAATIGFLAAAWGFWSGLNWWRPLAWAMVALSFALFITWWNAFPPNVPIQANAGNLVVAAGLMWLK